MIDDPERATWGLVDSPDRLRVTDSRRTNLPQIEEGGLLRPLDIGEQSGLAERIHLRFFGDNFVGSDFNFYGPRMSRAAKYLRTIAGYPILTFDQLMRRDVFDQLSRFREVRLIQFGIGESFKDEVNRTDSGFGAMFRAAADQLDGVGRLTIDLSVQPRVRGHLPARLLTSVRNLIGNPTIRAGADVFKVKGRDQEGRLQVLDLLRDQLVAEREIARLPDKSRALDPSAAYEAIESAYEELGSDLENAVTIRDEQ